MVSNVSAGMILGFINYHGKRKVTLEEMFKRLSLEMGGDGTKITKKQLDDYINKAESGLINVSDAKLKALKKMQGSWDKLSKDGENITFDDLKKFPMLLMDITISEFEESDKDKKQDDSDNSKFNIKNYLKEVFNQSDSNEITKSDLESYLKSLLSESSADEENSDLVDALTNLIALSPTFTTIETEV